MSIDIVQCENLLTESYSNSPESSFPKLISTAWGKDKTDCLTLL
jgi:hypothetical protein